MITKQVKNIVVDFINTGYPKGNTDRGFAMACISLFIAWLDDSGYQVIKKKK